MKYIAYPLFGLLVIGAYAAFTLTATDFGTDVRRSTLPGQYASDPSLYGVAPIIWFTGFHGPAARAVSSGSGSSGGVFYGGGGSYGGYGGGK